jgi:hypothetical protein
METIKKLLTDGVVTIEEVLEYVEQYQRAMDAFDDAQIDKYYQEEHDNNAPEYYGDWECGEGTLHSHNEECDCPDSSSYFPMHSPNPIYIVASTLRYLEETLIFESDENGVVSSRDDYGGIAQRWTSDIDWTDSDLAVTKVFGDGVFERISDVTPHEKGYFVRYMRINNIN